MARVPCKTVKELMALKVKNKADARNAMKMDNDDYPIDEIKFRTPPYLEKHKKTELYKKLCLKKI